jgi:replicative DNA helicase
MAKIFIIDYEKNHPIDFNLLDKLTNELQKASLIILAARPSMGKTTLALNIAANAAKRGKTVLFFSLEMAFKYLVTTYKYAKKPSFSIDDSCDMYASDLLPKCKAFKRKHGNNLDLVIVDYLQMIKISGATNSKAAAVGEDAKILKHLAKELDVPVLVLSQLSRIKTHPTPSISQLFDLCGSSIEQDADIVWFIHPLAKNDCD